MIRQKNRQLLSWIFITALNTITIITWSKFEKNPIFLAFIITILEIISITFVRPEKSLIIDTLYLLDDQGNLSCCTKEPTEDVIKIYINGIYYAESASFVVNKRKVLWHDMEIPVLNKDDEIKIEYYYYHYPFDIWFRFTKYIISRFFRFLFKIIAK